MENRINIMPLSVFEGILTLRYLIIFTPDELIEGIKNGEYDYMVVLHTIDDLLNFECGTFAILNDDISNRIYRIITANRWEVMKTDPDISNYINELIKKFNVLYNMPKERKYAERDLYREYLKEVKCLDFKNNSEFYYSFNSDLISFNVLYGEELEKEEDLKLIIGSLNYLLKLMPGIIRTKERKERLNEVLDEIKKLTKNSDIKYEAKVLRRSLEIENSCLNTKKMIY